MSLHSWPFFELQILWAPRMKGKSNDDVRKANSIICSLLGSEEISGPDIPVNLIRSYSPFSPGERYNSIGIHRGLMMVWTPSYYVICWKSGHSPVPESPRYDQRKLQSRLALLLLSPWEDPQSDSWQCGNTAQRTRRLKSSHPLLELVCFKTICPSQTLYPHLFLEITWPSAPFYRTLTMCQALFQLSYKYYKTKISFM